MDMRPFLHLAAGQNSGAIRLAYFRAMPKKKWKAAIRAAQNFPDYATIAPAF